MYKNKGHVTEENTVLIDRNIVALTFLGQLQSIVR